MSSTPPCSLSCNATGYDRPALLGRRFKHPRRVVFLDSLPKNAMGKVQKFELKRRVTGR